MCVTIVTAVRFSAKLIAAVAPPPLLVSNAIQHALFDAKPKEHYLVVSNQFEAMITIGKSLEELLNLNQNHEFSYTREQLISMMDLMDLQEADFYIGISQI